MTSIIIITGLVILVLFLKTWVNSSAKCEKLTDKYRPSKKLTETDNRDIQIHTEEFKGEPNQLYYEIRE